MKSSFRQQFLAALVLCAGVAHANDVSYLGPDPRSHGARMRDMSGSHVVARGQRFSDLGELRGADENEAVFERVLREEERESLTAQGFAAPDIRRTRILATPDDTRRPFGGADVHG
jgi:hypothetical protein